MTPIAPVNLYLWRINLSAKMAYFFYALALCAGMLMCVQSGVNSQLRFAVANPVLAALISFGTGFIALFILQLVVGGAMPVVQTYRSMAWWKWTGGLLGAVYVTTVILTVPRIGVASLMSLSVAGQLLAAVVLDHYGYLGFAQHPANVWRILGICLIVAGVVLVVKN